MFFLYFVSSYDVFLLSLNPHINKHLLLAMADDSVFQCHVNLFVNFLSLLSFFSFNLITRSSSLFDTPFNCTYLLISLVPFSSCYSSWFKMPFAINSFIDLLLLILFLLVQIALCQVLLSWYDLPLHAVMCLVVPSQYCPNEPSYLFKL